MPLENTHQSVTSVRAWDAYLSGFVNRYHNHRSPLLRNAQDLTSAHSARMVKLLCSLFPQYAGNVGLILYILYHDDGEFVSGDSPHSAKKVNPTLREVLNSIEKPHQDYLMQPISCYVDVTEEEKRITKLLDLLESYLFQCIHNPGKADQLVGENVLERAKEFGVAEEVALLMAIAETEN